jgi:transcriptional regulator with AAA-type ATPase domain
MQNTIERGVILTGDRQSISEQALFGQRPDPVGQVLGDSGHFTSDTSATSDTGDALETLCTSILEGGIALETLEEALLEQAYREAKGNISAAARRLGLSRAALDYRLKKPGKV